jgi:hypothetical protein
MMNDTVYLSSAYLAPVSYYAKLMNCGHAVIEQHDHYMKQTYRNRCTIAGPEGEIALTVPIVKPDSPKCPMKDIRISDHGNWRHLHLNAIRSAYNSTPFFEYYEDDFAPFYEKRYDFLVDYNERLRELMCDLIGFKPSVELSNEYKTEFAPGEIDMREAIHPKRDFRLTDPSFKPVEYYQVFADRNGFRPNLSIIDLLFNMGPEALLVLRRC